MNNRVYDILRFITAVVLPALATLIITIFKIWNIPNGELYAATITAIDCFLGSILQISNYSYNRVEKIKAEYVDKQTISDVIDVVSLREKYTRMIYDLSGKIESEDDIKEREALIQRRNAYINIKSDIEDITSRIKRGD